MSTSRTCHQPRGIGGTDKGHTAQESLVPCASYLGLSDRRDHNAEPRPSFAHQHIHNVADFIGRSPKSWIQAMLLPPYTVAPFNLEIVMRSRPPSPICAPTNSPPKQAHSDNQIKFNYFVLPALEGTAWSEPRPILIPPNYAVLLEKLHAVHRRGTARRVILQGHAFFGKSSFLAYIFISRVSAGLPTVYLPHGSEKYIQVVDGHIRYLWLEQIHDSTSKEDDRVWLLLDCEKPDPLQTNWFIVQVCTEIRRAEMKAQRLFKDGSATTVLVMQPWTWEEVFAVLYLNDPSIANDADLLGKHFSIFNYLGPHPGLCKGLLSPKMPLDKWYKRLRLYEKGINVRIAALLGKGDITCDTCGLEYSRFHSYPHSHSFGEDEDLSTRLIALENPRDRIVMAIPDPESSKGYKETWLTEYVEGKFWNTLDGIFKDQGQDGLKKVFSNLRASPIGDFSKKLTAELWVYMVKKALATYSLELELKAIRHQPSTGRTEKCFKLFQESILIKTVPSATIRQLDSFTQFRGDIFNKFLHLPKGSSNGGILLLKKLKLLHDGRKLSLNPVVSVLEFLYQPAEPSKKIEVEQMWNDLPEYIRKPEVLTSFLQGLKNAFSCVMEGPSSNNEAVSLSPPLIYVWVVPKATEHRLLPAENAENQIGLQWKGRIVQCITEIDVDSL